MQSTLELGATPFVIQTQLVIQNQRPGESEDQWFERVVQANRDFRIERNAEGELEIMSPTGGKTGVKNSEINFQLVKWSKQVDTGQTFDSSTGFRLPNKAIRAPDASWVSKSKLALLSDEQYSGYVPLTPDFVIELRSPSDRLDLLQAKMQEYLEQGAKLGWLIDPIQRKVYVYQAGMAVMELLEPASISGDPNLPGFQLDLTEIW